MPRFFVLVTVITTVIMAHFPAFAAELGRTTIDGQTIVIDSDGTWRHAPETTASPSISATHPCNALKGGISFCPDPERLTIVPTPPPNFAALYGADDQHFVALMIEEIGQNAGVTPTLLKKAALTMAGAQMNISHESVDVIDERSFHANGMDYLTFSYAVTVDGLDILFQNNIFVGPAVSVQLLIWQFGHEASTAFHALGDHARAHLHHRM